MTVRARDLKQVGDNLYTMVLYAKGTIEEALNIGVDDKGNPAFHSNGMFENKRIAVGSAYCDTRTFKITLYNDDNTWGDSIPGK